MITRRHFHRLALGSLGWALAGCVDRSRYTDEDAARLEAQKLAEREASGSGPDGRRVYRGYRGLAELPYFELDENDRLVCVVEDLPAAIDVHAHFGMSLLVAPELDLFAESDRVWHLLDCDADEAGCALDLDVYINANFADADLRALRLGAVGQFTWGSDSAATHTLPNLVREMDETRVGQALILPIAFGLPFGDDLTERWMAAIQRGESAGLSKGRFIPGASVHPEDPERLEKLRRYAAAGARAVKLHPPVQRFYPDAPEAMEIYEECGRLGVVVFFHAGRAGIEPDRLHPYALPGHFERVLEEHPSTRFVLGHAGARDVADAIPLAARYENAWLDLHGQGLQQIRELWKRVGSERLLYGTDWPFYHLAATLAKILLVTEGQPRARAAILRGNALRLLGQV